jgi:hypothetical protein
MEFLAFLGRHVGPAIAVFIGLVIYVGGVVLDAHHLLELGVPGWGYQIIGALVFAGSLIAILFRFDQTRLSSGNSFRADAQAHPRPSPETSAPLNLSKPSEVRIFVRPDITPSYLRNFYDENTRLQASKLVEPFLGKWIRVSGKMYNVSQIGEGFHMSMQLEGEENTTRFMFLGFEKEQKDKVSLIRRGASISVEGKIKEVGTSDLTLSDCEIVYQLTSKPRPAIAGRGFGLEEKERLRRRLGFGFEHHVDIVDGAAGGGDDREWKRVRIKAVGRDGKRRIGGIEAPHLNVREVFSGDTGRKPVRLVGDFEEMAVPIHAVYFGRAFHRRFPFLFERPLRD